jgi:hypothetical protein
VGKVKYAKKQTDKFQKGLLTLCEESKECKEKDKQISEEGCCYRVRKVKNGKKKKGQTNSRGGLSLLCEESKECKETDRQIWVEGCWHQIRDGNKISTKDQRLIGGGPGIHARDQCSIGGGGPGIHARDLCHI